MNARLLSFSALALALVLGDHVPAKAVNGQISADYAVSFIGIPVGTGTMVATTDGVSYRTTLYARVVGIAAVFAGGSGSAVAVGRLSSVSPVPTHFNSEVRAGGQVETLSIGMAEGNVRSVIRNPDKPPHTRATPVLPEHLRGVVDPLSAGIFIAAGRGPVIGPSACDRHSRIYNGVVRFDLIYSYVGTRRVDIAGYQGDAVVCRVRFEPIAGYRADRADLQAARQRSGEVTLVPIQGSRALIPARIAISTGYGTGIAEATRLDLNPGLPTARRASAD
jgi:Protein of unknown function (DUF3108)